MGALMNIVLLVFLTSTLTTWAQDGNSQIGVVTESCDTKDDCSLRDPEPGFDVDCVDRQCMLVPASPGVDPEITGAQECVSDGDCDMPNVCSSDGTCSTVIQDSPECSTDEDCPDVAREPGQLIMCSMSQCVLLTGENDAGDGLETIGGDVTIGEQRGRGGQRSRGRGRGRGRGRSRGRDFDDGFRSHGGRRRGDFRRRGCRDCDRCFNRFDCGRGRFCSRRGDCRRGFSGGSSSFRHFFCVFNDDCRLGHVCRQGRCVQFFPECRFRHDCRPHEFCSSRGRCRFAGFPVPFGFSSDGNACAKDSECRRGQMCTMQGNCVQEDCRRNYDCPNDGESCAFGRCVPEGKKAEIPCVNSKNCPMGSNCMPPEMVEGVEGNDEQQDGMCAFTENEMNEHS